MCNLPPKSDINFFRLLTTMNTQDTPENRQKIIRHLMIYSGQLSDQGLLHGKMGVVILMCRYSRITGNSLYEDFAGELLDTIYENLNTELPVDFERGLCGIGWGIEYLVQNQFTQGDTREILKEVNQWIMERDPRRITDTSIEHGLGGILLYVQYHLYSCISSDKELPFDGLYLSDLAHAAEEMLTLSDLNSLQKQIAQSYLDIYLLKKCDLIPLSTIFHFMTGEFLESQEIDYGKLGLRGGLAGALSRALLSDEQDKYSE